MSSSDQDKQRNRKIAENEANRQVVGDVRVSVWAIAVAIVAGVIVFGYRLGVAQPLKIACSTITWRSASGACRATDHRPISSPAIAPCVRARR